MQVLTGLDILKKNNFNLFKGRKTGLVCNQASVAGTLEHAVDLFYAAHQSGKLSLNALFGPQHGLWGHTQDNMIEWEGGFKDPRTMVPVYSLYGENRKPTGNMLDGLEVLVIDMQDVGAKYYTFIWTMALCMEACQENDIEVVVLDRPNPIGGNQVEGPFRHGEFTSFVGWHDMAIRHGLTIGEIAKYLLHYHYPDCQLTVVEMQGWKRDMYFEATGLPFAMPSPNIPATESTVVYPGQCLLEATNISEGRGTTRPFELFGAAFVDGWQFAEAMQSYHLPGVVFRPLLFQPTFHKFADEICGGCFIHVVNRQMFKPFLTTIALLREMIHLYPDDFAWKNPPYEYEYIKMPFDILASNDWLRQMLEAQAPLAEMEARWLPDTAEFEEIRKSFLLY
ncbi:MAG: DUF1343 domain-containing protein [Calditrichaeota bacterium]|nr:DUF1343 domain-containing protein [Calditrichota bacterium]